jgi:transcriptional regulator GlxA family with amidase domain
MTDNLDFPPKRPLIVIVLFAGAQLLDVAGPAEVFSAVSNIERIAGYEVCLVSLDGGSLGTSSGVWLNTTTFTAVAGRAIDTLLVVGGPAEAIRAAMDSAMSLGWLRDRATEVRRLASVCSGVFVLGAAGLISGRRVTTHWSAASQLSRRFPESKVDPDAMYVRDGSLWTSGGVTAGIDMALAMVADDHGAAVARRVAQHLVLSIRRPGGQSQYSPLLTAQQDDVDPFSELLVWIRENLASNLDVPILAARAGLAERTFLRRFHKSIGSTPASFIEVVRVERARALLQTDLSLKIIATRVGFGSTARLLAAFRRRMGVTPQAYRSIHGNWDSKQP